MRRRRPNFLLISTDQQRADHLGCYGARVLRTPSIDSLAARGIRFDRAYVSSPVCMPNRASLVTGRMPSLHGVRHNGLNLPLDTVTIGDVLRAEGWATALVGKAHFQCFAQNESAILARRERLPNRLLPEARRPDRRRYHQEVVGTWRTDPRHDLQYPYYGFDSVDLTVDHGDRVEGHYSRWLANRHPDPDALRGPENALPGEERAAPQAWRTAMPEELYPTRYIEEQTILRLNEYARDPDTPFFLWASFSDPHHPFTPPGRYWSLYHPDEVEPPASFARAGKTGWSATLVQVRRDGLARLSGTAAIAVDEAELRAAIALTYGMIAMVDDAVGAILVALRTLGLEEDTIVIFVSDHGDLMGEFGLLFKGPYHHQALIRTPLIWADGRSPGARRHPGHVSTIDIAASMLQCAGVAPFNGMQGRPFVDDGGEPVTVRDCALIEDEVQTLLPGSTVRGRVRTLLADGWRGGPDGYEIFIGTINMAIATWLPKEPPFDPATDFAIVGRVASIPDVVVVSPKLGPTTIEEFIELAKSRPGELNYSSPGVGSLQHMGTDAMASMNGIKLVHVPYKGGKAATTAVLAGEVEMFMAGMPPAIPYIKTGELLALGVSSASRFPLLPEVPTLSETVMPGYSAEAWYGLFMAKGTPDDIVAIVNAAANKALSDPAVIERFANAGAAVETSTPDVFAEFVATESARWKQKLDELGLAGTR